MPHLGVLVVQNGKYQLTSLPWHHGVNIVRMPASQLTAVNYKKSTAIADASLAQKTCLLKGIRVVFTLKWRLHSAISFRALVSRTKPITTFANNLQSAELPNKCFQFMFSYLFYQEYNSMGPVCTKAWLITTPCTLDTGAYEGWKSIHNMFTFWLTFERYYQYMFMFYQIWLYDSSKILNMTTQIAWVMAPTWDPPGSWRPQVGPMLAPWILLSG